MTDPLAMSALDLAEAVRRRQLSPRETAEAALRRAADLDDRLGLFITQTPDLARRQAGELEDGLMAGVDGLVAAPLLGVPCPIKDLTPVAGVRLTHGSAVFADQVADVDDGVVTLLARAGTLMTGKTNTPEAGLPCYTEPDVAPPAVTPWDVRRTAGGSSGGAAAAVAAGVAPIAHASDGAGSIRIPASACGVVGLKVSRGRISPGPFGVDVAGLGSSGPIARTVADVAAVLDVMAQAWPGDVVRLPAPRTSFLDATTRPPPRLRVGLLTEPVIADVAVHPACLTAAEDAARLLDQLGHHVERVAPPFSAEQWAAFSSVWSALAASWPVPAEREAELRPLTRWLRATGRDVPASAYVTAIAAMQASARQVAAAWAHVDVVLSPTLADLPPAVGALRDDADPQADFAAQTRFTPWTSVWNVIGCPAVSLPLAWTDTAPPLPVGVMIGARFAEEETVLSLAAEIEQARPWAHRYAPLWASLEAAS